MGHPDLDRAWAFLRGNSTADLRFDENMRSIRYVIDREGRLIAPVMVAMLQAVDTVLFVPDCSDGAMELQVTLREFQERGKDAAASDRWRIYHGDPPDVRWAYLAIDAARFEGLVLDGEPLPRPNPLADGEPRLCRTMNQERPDDLRRLCERFGKMPVEQPVMVGIDPMGLDVRARFDVLRIAATRPMNTPAEAQTILDSMISQARTS